MGLLGSIESAVSGAIGSLSATQLPGLINQHYPGGLDGLLKQLTASGYGQQVSSWLGHGPNDPIDTDDLRKALNNQQFRTLAEKLGLPADQVMGELAKSLPTAVDKQSPDGRLQPQIAPPDAAPKS